jgi:hypothetical protein
VVIVCPVCVVPVNIIWFSGLKSSVNDNPVWPLKTSLKTSFLKKALEEILYTFKSSSLEIYEENNDPHSESPFYTNKKSNNGLGLGLSICKKFMEIHNGQIEYENEGGNTKFILKFNILKN